MIEYEKTVWVDGETKLNAENLNKLENIISLLVDKVNELETKITSEESKGE